MERVEANRTQLVLAVIVRRLSYACFVLRNCHSYTHLHDCLPSQKFLKSLHIVTELSNSRIASLRNSFLNACVFLFSNIP